MIRNQHVVRHLLRWAGLAAAAMYAAQPLTGAADEQPAGAPQIVVAQPNHNFGEIMITPTLKHDFEVRNAGSAVLEITDVRPSCGCTIAGDYDKVIAPGATGKIPLELRTQSLTEFTKKIKVSCNDPQTPQLDLTLSGTIKRYVTATPSLVRINEQDQNSPVHETVRVTVSSPETQLELQNDGKAGRFEAKLVRAAEPNAYDLIIDGAPPFEAGRHMGNVIIKTNVPEQPEAKVNISVVVPDRVQINPAQLLVSDAQPRNGRPYFVDVTNHGKTPVQVLGVSTANPAIKTKLEVVDQDKHYRIRVDVPADYNPTGEGDALTLTLRDGTDRQEVVPIKVRGRRASVTTANKSTN